MFSCYPCNSAVTFDDLDRLRSTPTLADVNPSDAKVKLKEVQVELILSCFAGVSGREKNYDFNTFSPHKLLLSFLLVISGVSFIFFLQTTFLSMIKTLSSFTRSRVTWCCSHSSF